MLSSVRVASRTAASRQANLRTAVVGARFASAWSNVPQGPPVMLIFFSLGLLVWVQLLTKGRG